MARTFLSIGECMVELSQAGGGLLRQGFAGDTFNTAWYARAGLPQDWRVEYFTALGDDPMSSAMLAMMQDAGIGTSTIRRLAGRTPGLYLISLQDGERSFSYWRDTSAARRLAEDADHLRATIAAADLVYFSGITLAILDQPSVETLLAELRRAKAAGKTVAFDPNIRPRLWPATPKGRADMLQTIEAGARAATLVLPSFDDEKTHFGDRDPQATIARYHALGAATVVVKNGPDGITLATAGNSDNSGNSGRPAETLFVASVPVRQVVDTTSAGDSFNGGFLARHLAGATLEQAAAHGAAVAACVIAHHGALIEPALLPAPLPVPLPASLAAPLPG